MSHLPRNIVDWIVGLGVEIVIAKSPADLKKPGIHLMNPTGADLTEACYTAIYENYKTIFLYLRPVSMH